MNFFDIKKFFILLSSLDFSILLISILTYFVTYYIILIILKNFKKSNTNHTSPNNIQSQISKKYKTILDQISEFVIITDQKGICKYANAHFCSTIGINSNNIINMPIEKFFVCNNFEKIKNSEENILQTFIGYQIPVLISIKKIYQGNNTENIIYLTDLRKIKHLTKKLKKCEEISSASFHYTNISTIIIERKTHKIIDTNKAACNLTGYSKKELIGKSCNFLICPYKYEECAKKLRERKPFLEEEKIIKKNGSISTILRGTSFVTFDKKECIFETIIDISSRKKAEELIMKTRHLESIGTLASGIAHEFNNINNIMQGAIDMLFFIEEEKENKVPENVKNSLNTIKKMIERGANITNDLMIFTSETNDGCEKIELLNIVEESIYDFKIEIEDFDIKINNQLDKNLFVIANRSEIKSVFNNLISNAIHSVAERKERIINISYEYQKENYINIIIKDTGCGIPSENLEKIFDPFFSTKGINAQSGSTQSQFESRGLGLSVCHTILEKHHNGKIDIYSKPEKGTKVIFSLKAN